MGGGGRARVDAKREKGGVHALLPTVVPLLSAAIKVSSDRCDQNRTEQMRCGRTLWPCGRPSRVKVADLNQNPWRLKHSCSIARSVGTVHCGNLDFKRRGSILNTYSNTTKIRMHSSLTVRRTADCVRTSKLNPTKRTTWQRWVDGLSLSLSLFMVTQKDERLQ